MSWALLFGLVVALGLAFGAALLRRMELSRMERAVREREEGERLGTGRAQLQHPVIDLSRCLGCGTCVAACPEDGVLELVHGQAAVVNGSRCVGVSACERECPVGAVTVTIADLAERDDVPVVTDELEAVGAPGVFLAGEVTAHALIKTAIEHGARVAGTVAERREAGAAAGPDELDLVIVGAGPAGLACALEAHARGLRFLVLDQESAPGGTVAKYPRRKLVLTQPVELPLHGRLGRASYEKEELVDLWGRVVEEHRLPLACGQTYTGLERAGEGWLVQSTTDAWRARHVCLALGRRGSPRKLGVPGEELPKVAYGLLDARSYRGRRVLVVGGGDSAVETALGLAEQPGNEVVLSYRQERFFRVKARNLERLEQRVAEGRVALLAPSRVVAIRPDAVDLEVDGPEGPSALALANDEVFVLAGGLAPTELLAASGVSCDPALREAPPPPAEQGTGLLRALGAAFALSLVAAAFALWNADYYGLPLAERPTHPKHLWLRPSLGLGLGLGVAAVALVAVNLLYLLRRSPRRGFQLGSLQTWMTSHVATGILAFLCALLHAAMSPKETAGGHALWTLAALMATGAVGRYFYAWLPRATNGRELQLAEIKAALEGPAARSKAGAFRLRARDEVASLVERRQWSGSFTGRVLALAGLQLDLGRALRRIAEWGRAEGVPEGELQATLHLARRAHRSALVVAHFEDLRAVLNTWRWLHRWLAVLLVALIVLHVAYALTYGGFLGDGGFGAGRLAGTGG